jgi:hypothetical protein
MVVLTYAPVHQGAAEVLRQTNAFREVKQVWSWHLTPRGVVGFAGVWLELTLCNEQITLHELDMERELKQR